VTPLSVYRRQMKAIHAAVTSRMPMAKLLPVAAIAATGVLLLPSPGFAATDSKPQTTVTTAVTNWEDDTKASDKDDHGKVSDKDKNDHGKVGDKDKKDAKTTDKDEEEEADGTDDHAKVDSCDEDSKVDSWYGDDAKSDSSDDEDAKVDDAKVDDAKVDDAKSEEKDGYGRFSDKDKKHDMGKVKDKDDDAKDHEAKDHEAKDHDEEDDDC
jgi:hypothetical protein